MSKYLRTKDNLYQIESSFVDYKGKTIYQTVKNVLIEETDIIKKADTIKELCDFLVGWRGKDFMLYCSFELDLINKKEVDVIYGAIWTDKGLIYKAKLNKESGVLELL